MEDTIRFELNGKKTEMLLDPNLTLLWVLRYKFGYCTPGMIMNAVGLLIKNPEPSQQEIIKGMEDNLCRCGAHVRIIKAIQSAGKEMKGGK